MKKLVVLSSIICVTTFAGTGADLLLQSVGGDKEAAKPQKKVEKVEKKAALPVSAADSLQGIQLSDPFVMQLFSVWKAEKNLPYDVNQWAIKIFKQDYAGAAHLWSAIQLKIPSSFRNAAKTAQTYLYWKLGLPQTFWDAWVDQVSRKEFLGSNLANNLHAVIQPEFQAWFLKNQPYITHDQENVLDKVTGDHGPMFPLIQAKLGLRKGTAKAKLLETLPADHPYKVALSRTVALAYVKRNNLPEAAKVLKHHLEPAIEASRNPKLLSQHYLEVARLLYQAGNLEAAQAYYEKVPNSVPEFLNAREELTWIWLRQNNIGNLRGEVATLSSPLFRDVFAPEVPLVRAISNLKMCFYDAVEKDITEFSKKYGPWAKKIDEAIQNPDSKVPNHKDEFTVLAEVAYNNRLGEMAALKKLSDESIQAVLPAVGPQSHWVRAQEGLQKITEQSKKTVAEEYRRQWKDMDFALREGIRKMQFVKVELLTQVKLYSVLGGQTLPQIALQKETIKEINDPQKLTFKFDGVVWPDELFQLRSVAQAKCMSRK